MTKENDRDWQPENTIHTKNKALSQSGRLYQVIDKSAFFLF